MATKTPEETLNYLFPPLPVHSGGTDLSVSQFPGTNLEAQKALVKSLKENHEKYHIFFNDRGFHNHATHHLFAIYVLGATADLLEAAFKTHGDYQRSAFDSPGEVTESNWKEFLGDEKYYRAYLRFFTKFVRANGIGATLEKYIFETPANFADKREQSVQPQMLNRFLSGVLHPLIHAGYGCEFDTPGMVVEGIAMACVTATDVDALYPREFFAPSSVGTISRLTTALSLSSQPGNKGAHAFSILDRIQKDPELAPGVACDSTGETGAMQSFMQTMDRTGHILRKYSEEWVVDASDPKELQMKIDELTWAAVILYGIVGVQPGKKFNPDFFLMHLVTSSLLIPPFLKYLTPPSQSLLLRSYFTSILAVWVSRGRPRINIANFYANTSAQPVPPGVQPTPAPDTLVTSNLTPNPWFAILQTTIMHPNEHLCKAQRALAHFANVYGLTEKGYWKEEETHLENSELLDGTLFIRAAGLTATALGWMREGEPQGKWDYIGFWA